MIIALDSAFVCILRMNALPPEYAGNCPSLACGLLPLKHDFLLKKLPAKIR